MKRANKHHVVGTHTLATLCFKIMSSSKTNCQFQYNKYHIIKDRERNFYQYKNILNTFNKALLQWTIFVNRCFNPKNKINKQNTLLSINNIIKVNNYSHAYNRACFADYFFNYLLTLHIVNIIRKVLYHNHHNGITTNRPS